MIKNAILFSYQDDSKLANYFSNCAIHAEYYLNLKNNIKQSHVKDNNCNFAYIEGVELPKHSEKSLFVIYSHGNASSFFNDNSVSTPFIHETIDCTVCLDGGLVYTNACSIGIKFGKKLIEKNASFFGYNKDIDILLDYEKVCIECDNWGLYKLLEGDTLAEARLKAKEKYNEKIDVMHPFYASKLMVARDSIVVYGNDLNKSFF